MQARPPVVQFAVKFALVWDAVARPVPVTVTLAVALAVDVPGAYCTTIVQVPPAARTVPLAQEPPVIELKGNGEAFYVNAIVAADNVASQRFAAQVVSETSVPITEPISGLPAFRYVRRFEPK